MIAPARPQGTRTSSARARKHPANLGKLRKTKSKRRVIAGAANGCSLPIQLRGRAFGLDLVFGLAYDFAYRFAYDFEYEFSYRFACDFAYGFPYDFAIGFPYDFAYMPGNGRGHC